MIKTYIDLKDLNFPIDEIPKIIFRTGRYSLVNLPVEIKSLYESELENNPEYSLFYFDDEDCLSFIKEKMNENVLTAYQSLIPTAFKADLWRYAVLYTYGGVYLDLTMHSLIPFNEILISGKKQIYVRDVADIYGMYNAFIATVPKSEILKEAIEKVCYNVANKLLGQIPLDVTGPSMLGSVFKHHFNLSEIPSGNFLTDIYIYQNFENKKISDENGILVIKNRLEKHYEFAYNENVPMQLIGDLYRPLNHYSRLWVDNNVFK